MLQSPEEINRKRPDSGADKDIFMKPNNSTEWYHVILVPKGAGPSHLRQEWELNLLLEKVEQRFLVPYRRGQPMVIKGKTITMDDLEQIRIFGSGHKVSVEGNIYV